MCWCTCSTWLNVYFTALQELLIGDCSKAQKELGWVRKTDFDSLVNLMVDADMAHVENMVKRD